MTLDVVLALAPVVSTPGADAAESLHELCPLLPSLI